MSLGVKTVGTDSNLLQSGSWGLVFSEAAFAGRDNMAATKAPRLGCPSGSGQWEKGYKAISRLSHWVSIQSKVL